MIRVLESFLRPYVKLQAHIWSKRLSLAEFVTNNSITVSKGYTAFLLNTREHPTLLEHLVISIGSTSNHAVKEAINRMKDALDDAKRNLVNAQERMKHQVDKARRAEE